MQNKFKSFKDNGFWIEKNFFKQSDLKEIFFLFYDISLSMYEKKISKKHKFKNLSRIKYNKTGIILLDKILMKLFKKDKRIIGEIYDTVSYSSTFLRFFSNKEIEELTRMFLELPKKSSLYGFTNRVRIDPPKDERRTYGWHQEVFYNVPKTKYLQTWCPIIRNTTIKNGTIQLCPGSHKEKIAKQKWKDIKGKATQILIDKKIVEKYPNVSLEMKVGDLLFFDGHLFHRSGHNTTVNEIRFSMVGMWNAVNTKDFKAPIPKFLFRGQTPREYYKNHFNN